MKNRSKIDQKYPKIALGESQGALGLLEALGGQNRPRRAGIRFCWTLLGAVLAVSWPVLAASWGRLGRPGGLLGPSWARLGPVLAAKIGPRVDSTSMQRSIIFLMPFEIGFLMDFGRFWERK